MTATLTEFLTADGFVRFELARLPTGHATVRVHINGRPGIFVVDSGAGGSVIHNAVAGSFDLEQIAHDASATPRAIGAGGHMDLAHYRLSSFAIEDAPVNLPTLRGTDLAAVVDALQAKTGTKIDGVIGQDFLIRFGGIIDVANNNLFLKLS